MEQYLSGEKLYGDDLTPEEIQKWYQEESEAYANLGAKDASTYVYEYHALNRWYGFRKLKGLRFRNAMGFGSAWGHEFIPLAHRIDNLTIVEPSDHMISEHIGSLEPVYVKPTVTGDLPFSDNSFDLITCFGVLHHIPNVSFVLHEIIRVLEPGGHLLLREPVNSMGDWRQPRPNLTKHERGIPLKVFREIFDREPVEIVSCHLLFTATSFIDRVLKLKKPLFTRSWYIYIDDLVSYLLKGNIKYHATRKRERIAPSNVFYLVRKKG